MEATISRILKDFESGRLSRRQVIGSLSALLALAAGSPRAIQAQDESPFQAVGTNHVALRVTDLERSRDFYSRLLGIPVTRQGGGSCFLGMRRGFLALFRRDEPGLDHYCFAVEDYDVERADELLQKEGLKPRRPRGTQRIYFKDPDGIEVQFSAEEHQA